MKDAPTRTARINLRCTPREREQLEEAAQASGQTLTDFILDRCLVRYTDYRAAELAATAKTALEGLSRYLDSHYTYS